MANQPCSIARGSDRLLERLEAAPVLATPREADMPWILRARVAAAQAEPAAMFEAVATATAERTSTRDVADALRQLGGIGTPEHLARLATLPLGKDNALANNDRMTAWRDDAIAAIRRRHWRHVGANAPSMEPTTGPTQMP